VGELRLLLQNVTLQVDIIDRRLWRLDTSSVYTVRSAYNFLNVNVPVDIVVHVPSLWHKDIPLKVVLFAWRLFQDSFLQRTTYTVVKLLTSKLNLVLEVVGRWKHLLTFSYIVFCLGLFGITFLGGLVYLRLCLVMHPLFLISLVFLRVLASRDVLFYRLSGLQQCGKFGKKEITGFSMANIAQLCKWWTRLSHRPSRD